MMIRAHAARSAKGRLEPFEYDPGQIGPHQLDVRVTHCGICHIDAAMVDNDWGFTRYPRVPGHEAVGATVRVHPIMTHGGSQVNVIPADVRLETFVRAQTLEAIADADRKVDRALRAGALALGCKVEIETLPGYMPMRCDPTLVERFRPIAEKLVGAENVRTINHRAGAAVGQAVVAKAKPPMTRESYLKYQRGMSRREVYEG
jgi:acetylornithine deacetylase/succinyl-diaminopimelate desuccinylase-like protein